MTETKETRNARVQARYDELMREGKHGHYETLFRVIREEVEREREACARIAEDYDGPGTDGFFMNERGDAVRAAQDIAAVIRTRDSLPKRADEDHPWCGDQP